MTEFLFDEEHTYGFVCSKRSAEQFNCVDRLSSFNLFYFLWRFLKHHDVRNDDGSYSTYYIVPDDTDECLEEDIVDSYKQASPEILFFDGCRILSTEDSYWAHDPQTFLKAHGFDPAMADDVDFEFLHPSSDRCDKKASYE